MKLMLAATADFVEMGGGPEATFAIVLWSILVALITFAAVSWVADAKRWGQILLWASVWAPCLVLLFIVGSGAERELATEIYCFLHPHSSVGWWMHFPNYAPYLSVATGLTTIVAILYRKHAFRANETALEPEPATPQQKTTRTWWRLVIQNASPGIFLMAVIMGWVAGASGLFQEKRQVLLEWQLADACNRTQVHLDALQKIREGDTAAAIKILERDMYGNGAVHILSQIKTLERDFGRTGQAEIPGRLKLYYAKYGFAEESELFQGGYSLKKEMDKVGQR